MAGLCYQRFKFVIEDLLAKRTKKKRKQSKQAQYAPGTEPWIGKRTGLAIVGLVSLALAIFVAYTTAPGLGWGMAILLGLGFGIAMWGVFALAIGFNKWVRGR